MRNSIDENFYISGKNSHYYVVIPIDSWVGSKKTVKDHYYTGTENLTLIGTNDKVVVFYAQMDEKDIEFAGMVDFNSAKIEELISLSGIGNKIAEKIINKRNELGRYNLLEDIMLAPGIGSKTYEKIF